MVLASTSLRDQFGGLDSRGSKLTIYVCVCVAWGGGVWMYIFAYVKCSLVYAVKCVVVLDFTFCSSNNTFFFF